MDQAQVDYIVVGGGSSGSVVTGRLSEDAGTSVALLEAGRDGRDWMVRVPVAFFLMIRGKRNNWAFETVPQKGLNGRKGYQPRGKGLGGSSSINAMIYIRGDRWDYDHWASLGNEGWSYDEVLRYFRRSEHNERLADPFHGQGGPLNVTDHRSDNPLPKLYVDAMVAAGIPFNPDFNGASQEGVGPFQVTMKDGERCSAARAFVHPHMGRRDNLQVVTGALATRILFEGKRAIGVEFIADGRRQQLLARREVIISAGALQSPQLLLVSGVGPADQLAKHGIPLVHHLPGVGENLQDHPDFLISYRSRSLDTYGVSVRGGARLLREISRYRRSRRGMVASNIVESGGFIRTDLSLPAPDIQIGITPAVVDDHGRRLRPGHGFSSHVLLLRPKSRGRIMLQSSDMAQPPLIDPAFLEHPDDLEAMVKAFKIVRELDASPGLEAVRQQEIFTSHVRSDDDIRAILRARTDSIYHPVGTCKMGKDAMAVVDAQLRVHGIQGLRVVDASIMPTLIGGNTNAPAIMIGEKAVDMITGRQMDVGIKSFESARQPA